MQAILLGFLTTLIIPYALTIAVGMGIGYGIGTILDQRR